MRAERLRQRLSQERLAELARLDRTYISGLERGMRNPALSTIEHIARGLDVRVSKLFEAAERQR